MKPFSWSFSKLKDFETCPAKYKYYQDNVPFDATSKEAKYGRRVHDAFEKYLRDDTPLPEDLKGFTQQLFGIKNLIPGDVLTESQFALDKDLVPTGWFYRSAWHRSILDFAVVNTERCLAIVIDHKTGNPNYVDWDQVKLQAAVLSACYPEIKKFIIGYFWTKTKSFECSTFNVDELPDAWEEWKRRVSRLNDAYISGDYPAIQNFLCARHCVNTNCKFNGGK